MKVHVISKPLNEIKSRSLVLTVFEDDKDGLNKYETLDNSIKNKVKSLIESNEVKGKYKEFTILHTDETNTPRVLIMGLGKKKEFTVQKLQAVMGISARNMRRINIEEMTVVEEGFEDLNITTEQIVCAMVEGISLGLYRFNRYKSSEKEREDYRKIKNLNIVVKEGNNLEQLERAALKGSILAESTNFVRDLVNEPACTMTPSVFADEAERVAKENGIKITVLGKEDLEANGMNAFLAVNKGSYEPPRMVVMEYMGNGDAETLALVGKGVTFDSGGLSIKPSDAMFRMHCDMGGAAAVLGAMEAISKQKLKVNVIGVMGLTENLVDAHSYKVGDVITTMEGKTVEVLNTDAEGRLVLADALAYVRKKRKVDRIVDIATLTGAIVIALGHFCSGIMGNDRDMLEKVKKAGETSGEKVWELPMFDEYKAQIRSDIADLENVGGRPAGSITAAKFLEEFVGGLPWVHIDIAGTAIMDDSTMTYVKNPYLPKEGATGVGTRLLYQLAEDLSEK